MAKKMDIDQIAQRLVEIKKGLGELANQKTELEDEKAELEETFKLVVKKRDIRGVPVENWFVGVAKSTKVLITDDAKLLKAIKARKWTDQVFEQKLNKVELDKLVKAEAKENKDVPGTKVETNEYVKVAERKDEDGE